LSVGGVGEKEGEGKGEGFEGLRFCRLSVGAVLVGGGGGADRGAVQLLAVSARRHALVDAVEATRLLEVTDLPRGRETLNG